MATCYMVRKVSVKDAGKERRAGETLVFNQTGPNWWDVDAYLTDAPAEMAVDWVLAVLANLK